MLLICVVFGTKLHAKVVICFRFEHLDMHSACIYLVFHYLSSKGLLFRSGKLQRQTKPAERVHLLVFEVPLNNIK